MDAGVREPAVHDRRAVLSLSLAACWLPVWLVVLLDARSLTWLGGAGSLAAVVLGALSERTARRQHRKASWCAVLGQVLGMAGVIGAIVLLTSHR